MKEVLEESLHTNYRYYFETEAVCNGDVLYFDQIAVLNVRSLLQQSVFIRASVLQQDFYLVAESGKEIGTESCFGVS